MALGKPIVTTDMPECRKYESVMIARNHDEFINQLDEALLKRDDPVYLSLLKEEALANTWGVKAQAISSLIRDNLQ
jgi:hypothetical protein